MNKDYLGFVEFVTDIWRTDYYSLSEIEREYIYEKYVDFIFTSDMEGDC